MNNSMVTVCIVTYNQKKYIEQCLDSIVNQKTDYSYQVIISDDASTDGTSEICAEYAKRYQFINHIRHATNIGAYENFKYVHRQAKTQYVSHCDADDSWHEDKLEKQIKFLEGNSDCCAVYSNAIVINEHGTRIGVFNNSEEIPSKITIGYLLEKSNFLNNSSMIYRRDMIGDIFDADGKVVDYRIHIHLANCGLLGYIKESLAFYRKGAAGGLCLNAPAAVGQLVHEARLDGIKNAKLSIVDFSKIKTNAWYGKLTCFLKRNKFMYARHTEVEALIVDYDFIQSVMFLFFEIVIYFFCKMKEKLSINKNIILYHR
ncbi:glycosyl transferase, family 2 [Shewanella sp. W3-18-1]|uniref:glycosyltransferase n=1 Tax=Shewanella sp. (strain W3-18-1) TaxID=351745 RepID=UPI00005FDF2F|nr:glycosyltransferase [Shewanella sp. W3-18-1]ABM24313.1 glycosyl transferase, family 2 [Shewanella sp. W3-18-1]